MSDILKKIPKGYFQTEFDLVNDTNFPVSFNLFDVNTLSVTPTQASPILPPSIFSANIPLGGGSVNPIGLAYNTISNTIYSANTNDTVSVIDCNSNLVISTISLPAASTPFGISYNSLDNTMYVACIGSNDVYIIDCNTNTIVGLPISVGNNPKYIAYNTLNNRMYVSNNLGNSVSVINCITNLVITTIVVGTGPEGISYNSINNTMYVCNADDDTVSVINCNTNLVIATISVGTFPLSVGYNTINNTIYVVNAGSDDVYVIDCDTNTVIGLPITVGTAPDAIAYNSLLNLMYVTNFTSINIKTKSISVIDCSTNLVVNTISTALSISKSGIVFNVNDNTFFVSSIVTDDISVLSPASSTTTYIGGTFNYNQFIQDIQDNPALVRWIMFYSSDADNINQVFFTLFKDADGKSSYTPQYPQLSIGVNQFQGSVSKVDFGKKGVLLDSNNSFYDVTVQANSTLKLVLIMKQMKKAYNLDAPDISENMDLIKSNIQYVKGVDSRNNIERFSVFNLGSNEK